MFMTYELGMNSMIGNDLHELVFEIVEMIVTLALERLHRLEMAFLCLEHLALQAGYGSITDLQVSLPYQCFTP